MSNISKIKHEEKIYNKTILLKEENFKSIFRLYRSLKIIDKKSNYIVQLKNIRLNNDNSEIIFSFIDGGISLSSLINSKVYDYRTQNNLIKWILFQILKGLETVHSLNIIHRDINPNHILISSKGEIRLTGFENSINDIESKFIEDKVVGQISYVAPECLLQLNFNNKSDIWSVGVIMLELYLKTIMILKNDKDDIKEDDEIRAFKQLKSLSKFSKMPFNFTENDYHDNIEKLIAWLNNAKLEEKKLNEIFENLKELEEEGLELLKKLLCFNPKERITCKEALKMPYFHSFQYLNKDEYKKNKSKQNNEDLSVFIKNLEKEFSKVNGLQKNEKNEIFQKEIYKISQFKEKVTDNY